MTDDTRSPEEIEREIERERAGLKNTLDDLQDRFSIDNLVRQVSDQFRAHGGEIGRSISDSVKSNPMALALTGVGLAWLMMSDRSRESDRTSESSRRSPRTEPWDDRSSQAYGGEPTSGVGLEGRNARTRFTPAAASSSGYYSRTRNEQRDLPAWAQRRYAGRDWSDTDTDATQSGRVSNAAHSVADAARGTGDSLTDSATGAAAAISDAASSSADKAREFGRSASDAAASLRDRLFEGTESLSDEARERVVAARQKAIEARDSTMHYARQGRDQAVDLFEQQPLIAGALALAVGAAIGAALPRSRVEDEYFGDYSDRLMDEAERLFDEESQKVKKVVEAVSGEAKDVAADIKDQATEAGKSAVKKVKSAGKKIAEAAKVEARTQDLGPTSSGS